MPPGNDVKTVFALLKLLGHLTGDLYKSLIKANYTTDDLAVIASDLNKINDHFRPFSTLGESINPNMLNMLIRKFEGNIRTPDDIAGFFLNLNKAGIMMHCDDDFLAEPGINPLQADKLNDIMKDCWNVSDEFGVDIYGIGNDVLAQANVNYDPAAETVEVEEDKELKTWGVDAEVLQEEDIEDETLVDTATGEADLDEFIRGIEDLAGADENAKVDFAYEMCKDYDDETLKSFSKSLTAMGQYAILLGVSSALLDKQNGQYKTDKSEVEQEFSEAEGTNDEAYFDDGLDEVAAPAIEGWDMNDPAVYKDVLDELVHLVRNIRQKSKTNNLNDEDVTFEMASGYDTPDLQAFLHILASHPEMQKIADGMNRRITNQPEEPEDPLCSACNGTGEGRGPGASCSSCGGSGVRNADIDHRINTGRRRPQMIDEEDGIVRDPSGVFVGALFNIPENGIDVEITSIDPETGMVKIQQAGVPPSMLNSGVESKSTIRKYIKGGFYVPKN